MSHIELPNFVFIAELYGLPENLRRTITLNKSKLYDFSYYTMLIMIILGCSLFFGLGLWIDVW